MAYLNYTPPASWIDGGLDWTAPDLRDRRYLHALILAIGERMSVAVQSPAFFVNGAYFYHPVSPSYRVHPAAPCQHYSVGLAARIASSIHSLAKDYYLAPNPDAGDAVYNPYVPLAEALAEDDQWKYLSIPNAGLISGQGAVRFFKAARYFLDLCTITRPREPMIVDRRYRDQPAFDETSWSAAWTSMSADAITAADESRWHLSWHMQYGYEPFRRVDWRMDYNVRYVPQSRLACSLIVNFRDWTEVSPYFGIGLDPVGHGWSQGLNAISVPAGGGAVAITGTSISPPASWIAWEDADPLVPDRWNAVYRSDAFLAAVDFAVPGGFRFYSI